jgi:hypothetical protein
VRKVALDSTANANHPVVTQIDTWYGAGNGQFDGQRVPAGWNQTTADADVFRKVVRKSCRGCHITSSLPFDTAAAFRGAAALIGQDIKANRMPHALQTQRLFWQSAQPTTLASYFSSFNDPTLDAAAADIRAGSPNDIVTLDPQLIEASF